MKKLSFVQNWAIGQTGSPRAGVSERATFASPARRSAGTPIHLLCLLFAALVFTATACRKPAAVKPPDVDYYTCSMHPSVRKQSLTDKCPICSMDLEPVKKKGVGASDNSN